MKKPVIMVFAACYLPGYKAGGPIRTLANMTDRLGDEFDFYLVTKDRDLGDATPYANITTDSWMTVHKARVRYLRPEQVSFTELARLIRQVGPDLIYLNSFFQPHFTQRILWLLRLKRVPSVPVVLAPRGEFSSGALLLKSLKKRAYIALSKGLGLYRGIRWQASSEFEFRDIKKVFPKVPDDDITIAMNLAPSVRSDGVTWRPRDTGDALRVCFLSRISPKKNLDYAIKVLQTVRKPVRFAIYGPQSDPKYWHQCQRLIKALPEKVSVTWEGEVQPVDIEEILVAQDLFFLPTRGENYGHAIHEALLAGLPVLISDQTPWDAVEEQGIGWTLPLDRPEGFADVIDTVAEWDEKKRKAVFAEARHYARKVSNDDAVLSANRRLFLNGMKRD